MTQLGRRRALHLRSRPSRTSLSTFIHTLRFANISLLMGLLHVAVLTAPQESPWFSARRHRPGGRWRVMSLRKGWRPIEVLPETLLSIISSAYLSAKACILQRPCCITRAFLAMPGMPGFRSNDPSFFASGSRQQATQRHDEEHAI